MPRRKRNKKVKRYRRSFYSRGMKVKKALGILLLAAVVLGAAWLAAPYVLDWATHTWYTVVRDRELPASSEAVSSQADPRPEPASSRPEPASSQAASSQAAASSEALPVAGTAIREGSWASVSLSALGDEASIRATAQNLAQQGVTYALIPLKDATGYIYYASAVPAASRSVAAHVVDPARIAAIFKEEGLVPVAGVAAFQDPIAAYTDRGMSIQYAGGGGYLWLDAANAAAGGKAWLNPYADSAVQFIGDLIEELYGCGFEQVCLSAVQFPPAVSSSQGFGETGGLSRDARLAADIAAWDARFADRVTLWYEYPLASCTGVSTTLGALPAQLGVQNLVVSLPAGEAQDPALLEQTAQQMKQLGAAYVVVRDSESGMFY